MGTLKLLTPGRIPLSRNGLLRVEDGKGALVSVWQGTLWLTQEGDSRDHYLGTGERFRLDRDGAALVTALSEAVISVSEA